MAGPDSGPDTGYVRRVLVAVAVVVVVAAFLALLWYAFGVVLVLFASVLFAVLLDGLARELAAHVPLGRKAALGVVVLVLFGGLGAFGWLAGPRIAEQAGTLQETIPAAVASAQAWLGQFGWGEALLDGLPAAGELASPDGALLGRVAGAFSTAIGAVANLVVITFIGLYLAFDPALYVENGLRLVPRARRERAREVVAALGHALRSWLKGQFAAMLAVGVLTTAGLWALGVPLALSLGLIAGLFEFVPFLGPIVATVPAALVASLEGGALVLYVVALYTIIQQMESYLITPLIQQHAVSMPPALLIAGQVFFGVLGGIPGVILATPLLVCVMVLVQMLYVEDVLDEDARVMGE